MNDALIIFTTICSLCIYFIIFLGLIMLVVKLFPDSQQRLPNSRYSGYWSLNGRMKRSEFFLNVLIWGLLILAFPIFSFSFLYNANRAGFGIFIILFLFFIFPFSRLIIAYIKRLHDLGWSGWWAVLIAFYPLLIFSENTTFILIVSLIIFILSFILFFMPGTNGANKYGQDPLIKKKNKF